MLKLTYQEIKIQNQVYNLTKYIFIFFIFSLLSVALINDHENITKFGIIFTIICIPLAFINLTNILIKPDINDGNLEMMLISFSPQQIILAKFLAICFCSIFAFSLLLPLIYFIFNLTAKMLALIAISSLLLILLSSSVIILIAAVQGYFRSNTNFLSIILMPLIIPNIILSGIAIQNNDPYNIIAIMFGIGMIIIPCCLYLASYLITNIYNI